jgi:hypothetical protein
MISLLGTHKIAFREGHTAMKTQQRITVAAFTLLSILSSSYTVAPARADSEASSEASSEAGSEANRYGGRRRGRGWYYRQQMQQQRREEMQQQRMQQKQELQRQKAASRGTNAPAPHMVVRSYGRKNFRNNQSQAPVQKQQQSSQTQ